MITQDQLKAAEEAFGSYPKISIHKLDKTHRKILLICEDYPEAINDRPLLLAKFYEDDWDTTKSLYYNFTYLTRVETVVRRFRDLREWGYVQQSDKADKYNYEAMKSERDKHSEYSLSSALGFAPIKEITDKLTIRQAEPPVFTPYKQTELL